MNLGTPLATGNTATIYRNENKVIKVFKDYLPDTEALYEANKQKYVYSCELSVPKVFDVTKIDGKQAIIMEFVEGQTIGEKLTKSPDQAEYYMNISIDVQLKIHSIQADGLEPMSEKLSRQIKSVQQLSEEQKSSLLQQLDSTTDEKRLCHGDLHIFNLIMSENNKVTIIDWVDASSGDFRADVCRTYLLYTQYSPEIADMYLHLYCSKSGLSKEEVLQWKPILTAARLSENVINVKNEDGPYLSRINGH